MANEYEVTGQKNNNLVSVVVVAVLIAIGAALRLFVPPAFGITPNFIIAMYCLAILLTRPKLSGALAIGIVGGAVSMLTSKSAVPYVNLVSDLVGAFVCYLIVALLPKAKAAELFIKPVLGTFMGTVASGGVFVFITKVILVWKVAAAMSAFTFVVLPTALVNCIITYILYLPTKRVFNVNSEN